MSKYNFNPQPYKEEILGIINEVKSKKKWTKKSLQKILPMFPRDGNSIFSRDQLVMGYRQLVKENLLEFDQMILDRIKMKPTRTISGVAPITVLTKPFPCPGKCIFCPNDVRMPKSYLADEPGAQRAERNQFDPYLQTYNRLKAMHNTGHNVEKVELIVLGGTWSFYPTEYQIWFIKRCFDALNDYGVHDGTVEVKTKNIFEEADRIPRQSKDGRKKTYNEIVHAVARQQTDDLISKSEKSTWDELEDAHTKNEKAKSRCVGLVIETRPDYIDEEEIIILRRLGATKIQIGIQSLNDEVMKLNKRGHGSKETAKAIELLRLGGFKIHAHWMPNLYGSTVEGDISDFRKLWTKKYQPDELKIYPTSIIANTELYQKYKLGKYQPYSYDELLKVLTETMKDTPRYCRLTRVVRDIPSTDIVAGNKLTNFRQIAEDKLRNEGRECKCIRCREIKGQQVQEKDIEVEQIKYETTVGTEIFISYKTKEDDKILGFLRLELVDKDVAKDHFIPELRNSAIIREVHVYGQVVGIGKRVEGRSQHLGLGTRMIDIAKQIAKEEGHNKLAVISAIGTRDYYRKQGFEVEGLYMICPL